MAALQASIHAATDRMGIISGDKGHLIVENINNPQSVKVLDTNYQTVAVNDAPQQITGYEYQVYASLEAIEKGWLESLTCRMPRHFVSCSRWMPFAGNGEWCILAITINGLYNTKGNLLQVNIQCHLKGGFLWFSMYLSLEQISYRNPPCVLFETDSS